MAKIKTNKYNEIQLIWSILIRNNIIKKFLIFYYKLKKSVLNIIKYLLFLFLCLFII